MTLAKYEQAKFGRLSPRDAEQMRRTLDVLDLAAQSEQSRITFTLHVSALHLARAIPEYWYTAARDTIPFEVTKNVAERKKLAERLVQEFEEVLRTARRYNLLTELRRWDFHWEPLIDAQTFGPGMTYGRGAPVRLSTGSTPNSSAVFTSGNRLFTIGSGHRIGRANYYQIQKSRYVDAERSEAVPLDLAIRQFVEDLSPMCD